MAQVPYNPVPQVSPQNSGMPYQSSTGASPEAFGAGVGAAKQRLGAALEQTGDMLANHAIRLQDMANASAAKDLFLQADQEMGALDTAYRSLEQKAAVDAYPKFSQDVKALRDKFISQASNPEVARIFDQDFSRRAGFTIIDGARFAATQNKAYNNATTQAVVSNAVKNTAATGGNEKAFQDNLRLVKNAVEDQSVVHGWSDAEKSLKMQEQVSNLWAARIESIAQTNPFLARDLYVKNKDSIDGLTQMKIEKHLQQQYVAVATRTRADQIVNGTLPSEIRVNAAKAGNFWGDPNAADFREKNLTTIELSSGKKVEVNKQAAPSFQGFLNELEERGYDIKAIGGYSKRNIAGTNTLSQHAYGNAIDINPDNNPVKYNGQVVTDLPPEIGQLAAKYGLSWGGNWTGSKRDPMHFEWSGRTTEPLTPNVESGWLERGVRLAKEVARIDAPDDPRYEDTLIARVKAEYNNVKTVTKEAETANFNTVQAAVLGVANNQPMTSVDGILGNSVLSQAFFALPDTRQKAVLNQIEKNAKADVPLTGPRYARFQELMGKSVTAPDEFMKIVAGDEDLPRTLQSQIFAKQRSMQGKLQDTTKLNSALTSVRSMLNDAGIVSSRTDQSKAKAYDQFVGSFNDALTAEEAQTKKFPNEARQREIASKLIREMAPEGLMQRFGLSTPPRMFEKAVPEADATTIKDAFLKAQGRQPTDDEVRRIYVMKNYMSTR